MMRMISTIRYRGTTSTSKKNKKDKRGVSSRRDDTPSTSSFSSNKNKNLHPPNDDEYDYYSVPRILPTTTITTTTTNTTTKEEFSSNPFCLDSANGSNDFFIMMEAEATLQFHDLARQFVDFDVVREPPKNSRNNNNSSNKSWRNQSWNKRKNNKNKTTTGSGDQVVLLLDNDNAQTIETTITPPPVTTKVMKQTMEEEEEEGEEHSLGAWNSMVANSSTILSKTVTWIANDDDQTNGSNHQIDDDKTPDASNELVAVVVPVPEEMATPSPKVMIVFDAFLECIDPSDPLQLASQAEACQGDDYESFHSMLLPCLNSKKGDADAIMSSLFSFADEDDDECVRMDMATATGSDEVSWSSEAVDEEEEEDSEGEKDTTSLPESDGSSQTESYQEVGAQANSKNESNHQGDMFLELEYENDEEMGSTPIKDKAVNQTLVTTTSCSDDDEEEDAGDDLKNGSMESDGTCNLLSMERASGRVMIKAGPTRVELLQDFLRLGGDRASI
jgi:hypothetical protein